MERKLCNRDAIIETAKTLGLSRKEVEEVVNIQSSYIKHIMEGGTFDSIRLPNLGAFVSKPLEVQMLEHLKGLTPEQAADFKKQVRTGKIKLIRESKNVNNTNATN